MIARLHHIALCLEICLDVAVRACVTDVTLVSYSTWHFSHRWKMTQRINKCHVGGDVTIFMPALLTQFGLFRLNRANLLSTLGAYGMFF